MMRYRRLVRQPAAWLSVVVAAGCASILDIDGRYVAITGDGGHTSRSQDASTGAVDSGPSESGGAGGSSARSSGGSGNGGATTRSGGTTGSGGTLASGGETGSTGGATSDVPDCTKPGSECPKGQKCCGSPVAKGSSCYLPSPGVGCGDTGCDYCSDPVPTNSTPSCSASGGAGSGGAGSGGLVCSFTCDDGFVENSGACVPKGTGGAGAGGAGGKTGTGGRTSSGGSTPTPCQTDEDCSVSCGIAGPQPCCMPNKFCGCTFFQLQIGKSIPIGYCLPRPPGF
jgi:hypothetical protein